LSVPTRSLQRNYRLLTATASLSLITFLLHPGLAAAQPSPAPTPSAEEAALLNPVDAAKAEAKKAGRKTEIPSLHTESSTTYANSDGKTLTTEFHTDPIRVKQGDAWQPVDTTLISESGVIKPRATKASLALSTGGGTDLLTMTRQRDGAEIKVFAPRKLAAPRLTANRAEYPDAYGPGIDLTVVATPTGFRQEVVIRQRPTSPLKLPVPVQLPQGLSFGTTSKGELTLRDNAVEAEHRTTGLPVPQLIDAGANLAAGEEGRVGKVTASVEKRAAGQALVYEPDVKYLADPDVSYPVTLVVPSPVWTELPVGNDTYINNSSYQNGYANSGAYHLQAGKTNGGTVTWRTYIRFEEIPEDSPLRGGTVTNADLVLWNISSNDCGDVVGSGITARRIIERWDVATLTWSNQPTVTSTDSDNESGAYLPGCSRGYMDYEWDLYHYVNGIAQKWADGEPNYGFQLTSGSESERTNWRAYRSKEWGENSDGSHGPKLIIGYIPKPTTVRPFMIPYKANPTVGDVLDHDFHATEPEQAPLVTVEEALAARENAGDYFLEDSRTGFSLPDDLTKEEWLEAIDATEPGPTPSPSPDPDTTPPVVTSTMPWDTQTGLPLDAKATAIFNEAVTGTAITVKDAQGAAVPGTLSIDETSTTFTFTPAAAFMAGATYTVQVSGAADVAGNAMTAPHTWSFTTGSAGPTPTPTPTPTPDPGAAPTVSELSVAPATESWGMWTTSTTTPQLSARVEDSKQRSSTLEVEVEHDPEAGQGGLVWSGNALTVPSGHVGTVTVAAGMLADGGAYRWRARATTGGAAGAWSDWQYLYVDVSKPTVSEISVAPATESWGMWTTSTTTPGLSARIEDPEERSSTLEVQVEHDPEAGQGGLLWSGNVSNVPSGYVGTVTVAAGMLADGGAYRWRARATAGGAAGAWSEWEYLYVDVSKPTVAELSVAPATNVWGMWTTSTTTPWLSARIEDPEERSSTLEVEVEHDPEGGGSGLAWSGNAPNIPSGHLGTVTVAAGQLTSGGSYRWRARATVGGVSGAWSEWEYLYVDTSAQPQKTAQAPPTGKATAAAARKFPYNHVTHDECAEAVGKPERPAWEIAWGNNRRAFFSKNSYSMCYAMWIGERDEDDEVDRTRELFSTTKWYARVVIVLNTYVGKAKGSATARDVPAGIAITNSRQIRASIRVDQVHVIDDDWEDRKFRIALGESGVKCAATYNGASAKDGVEGTVKQWRDGGVRELVLSVPPDYPHVDEHSTCSVQPWVRFMYNPEGLDDVMFLSPFFKDKNRVQSFICDSAKWIKAYTGGCVVSSIRPVFILDANNKKNIQSAYHWWHALYKPDVTFPKKTGKVIPGRLDANNMGCGKVNGIPGKCLHRTTDATVHKKNRDIAIPTCTNQIRAYTSPDSCDEFPFASTAEGAASTTNDYSVAIIHGKDNCSSGAQTSVFYQRHRIRHMTSFWVDIIPPGATQPTSGAPGEVISDFLPEEEEELASDLCTVDGTS
jgi:hypothetical protein